MDKYNQLIESIDSSGTYQKILSLAVLLCALSVPGFVVVFPLMQQIPDFSVEDNGKLVRIQDENEFCNSEGNWNKIIYFESVITTWSTELNLVCNRKSILSLTSTAFFLGSIISSISFSKFADRFGRKQIFMALNILSFISLIQGYFLFSIDQLIIGSFMQGLASLNIIQGNIMLKELVDKRYYSMIFSVSNAGFPILGLLSLILFTIFKDWRVFQGILVLLITISNLLVFFFLEESPLWLYANKQFDLFEKVVQRIAKINNRSKQVKGLLFEIFDAMENEENLQSRKEKIPSKHAYTYFDLLRYKSIRIKTIILTFLFAISGFTFYSLLLNLSGLTGSMFNDAIITYLGEALAEVVSGNLSLKFGVKKTVLVSYLIGSVATLCCYTTAGLSRILSILLLFLGSIGISGAFNVMFIYAADLYPIKLNVFCISYLSLVSRIGSSLVPTLLSLLSEYILMVISVLSFGAAIGVTFLPSTEHLQQNYDVTEIESNSKMKQSMNSESDLSSLYLNQYYDSE